MDCDVILLLIFTGQTHEDRRQALEKLGISVQSSGIKVQMSPINLLSGWTKKLDLFSCFKTIYIAFWKSRLDE